jgi:SAM-dependent methyltransferase
MLFGAYRLKGYQSTSHDGNFPAARTERPVINHRGHPTNRPRTWTLMIAVVLTATIAFAQQKPFEPQVGQAGKDVVWVPSPEETVKKMMEMGEITPKDFVVDLGSGDGRNVIAAAKIGAQGLGVEYNPDMVELSKRLAKEAGVPDKAQFVQGDMFQAEFSKATALVLFLLPSNLLQLRDKFANLRPGTRIVSNTFSIQDWTPEKTETLGGDCTSWCTVMLYIVPAKVDGTWKLPQGELALKQTYQTLAGTLTTGGKSVPVTGKLRGDQISWSANGQEYSGVVKGNQIEGTTRTGSASSNWTATR